MSQLSLHQKMLAAHDANDKAALIDLYQQAGEAQLDQGNIDAGAFYLTHAYVFALDIGARKAKDLHQTLIELGREE